MELWKFALRTGNARVILLLLMATYLRDGKGPPHRAWGLPERHRARSRRIAHASLTGRRPRG